MPAPPWRGERCPARAGEVGQHVLRRARVRRRVAEPALRPRGELERDSRRNVAQRRDLDKQAADAVQEIPIHQSPTARGRAEQAVRRRRRWRRRGSATRLRARAGPTRARWSFRGPPRRRAPPGAATGRLAARALLAPPQAPPPWTLRRFPPTAREHDPLSIRRSNKRGVRTKRVAGAQGGCWCGPAHARARGRGVSRGETPLPRDVRRHEVVAAHA